MGNRVASGVLVAVLTGIVAAGCGEVDGMEAGRPDGEDRVRTVNVEVAAVVPQDFVHTVRIVGTVEADRDVVISAEEGGTVRQMLVRQGDRVRPGQPLFRLDAGVLQAQLEQAVSQALLAEETWERQRRLWEEDQIGTEMAYLQAKYNAQTARAQAQVLKERVDRTTIRAPIAGILEERLVEVGAMVSPGTPVARILDVDRVKVVGGVPERYGGQVRRGGEVTVTLEPVAGEFVGEIDHVGAAVDRSSRTFTIEVEVPNAGHALKPGMVANVEIARERRAESLVVPRHAVLRLEGGYSVFVAVPHGTGWRAESRPVVPGAAHGGGVVIEQGLASGERVVVVGQQRVAHGDALIITNEDELAVPAVEATDG
jgi:membrane fusion protein, multidrug efflux system